MPEALPLTLADVLEAMADAVPERPAVIAREKTLTFAELDDRASRLAHHLIASGLRPGEHVAIHSANRMEWVEAWYACFKARLVPINVNNKYLADELRHVYDNSDAVAAIVSGECRPLMEQVRDERVRVVLDLDDPETSYDDLLAAQPATRPRVGRTGDDHYVLYTGGTTGAPKGVVWRQEDLLRGALNAGRYGAPLESVEQLAAEAAAHESPLTLLACGPMMHGGSQWILGNGHVAGFSVALFTDPSFTPEGILDLVEHARVSSLTVLGDAMARPLAETILAEPDRWDLSSLVAFSNGAAPLSGGVREQLREALPGRFLLDSYGASESGATGSRVDDGGDDGSARFGVTDDVEVFDVDWTPAAAGVQGLLGRKGPIPLGYYNDPVKTAATFREIDGVRWVIPGDAARREEDGTVTVLGRGSVCINTGGEKVHPEEVEGVLLRHPDVFDAVVVGTPHERWGQQVTALVQRREGAEVDERALIDHVHGLLANYKAPKRVLFVDQVPRTAVSKVDYPASLARAVDLLADGSQLG